MSKFLFGVATGEALCGEYQAALVVFALSMVSLAFDVCRQESRR